MEQIISNYGLFNLDEEFFWSESLLRRMEERDSKVRKAKESAQKRWEDYYAKQEQSPVNTNEDVITFDLTLGKPERVTIELFDALGNKIAVVANNIYYSGNHTIQANLLPYSTGLLYYRVMVGGNVRSGVVMVIR